MKSILHLFTGKIDYTESGLARVWATFSTLIVSNSHARIIWRFENKTKQNKNQTTKTVCNSFWVVIYYILNQLTLTSILSCRKYLLGRIYDNNNHNHNHNNNSPEQTIQVYCWLFSDIDSCINITFTDKKEPSKDVVVKWYRLY